MLPDVSMMNSTFGASQAMAWSPVLMKISTSSASACVVNQKKPVTNSREKRR
jgi:hypothetical protein